LIPSVAMPSTMYFWNAMNTKLKNSEETLSERLIAQKVFTQAQFNTASSYAKNGKPSGGGSSSGGTSSGGTSSGGTSSGGSTSGGTTDVTKPKTLTWEEYNALSGEKQYEYFQSFSDPMDFFAWQEEAKAAYDKAHPTIEVGKEADIIVVDQNVLTCKSEDIGLAQVERTLFRGETLYKK